MIGYLVGALIFSAISDKKGRRYSDLLSGVCLLVISSISIAFVNSYTMFIILRLILAASAHGIGLSTFVLYPVGWNIALTTIGKLGVGIAFTVAYIMTAELVPTHVRNIAIGMCSVISRIGSRYCPLYR
ncbi:hypothetical protein Avbf_17423 [Armadillidium vulgare]|nr:hypothetical protein Avbf_17423 [Armadillidium vulgare]